MPIEELKQALDEGPDKEDKPDIKLEDDSIPANLKPYFFNG